MHRESECERRRRRFLAWNRGYNCSRQCLVRIELYHPVSSSFPSVFVSHHLCIWSLETRAIVDGDLKIPSGIDNGFVQGPSKTREKEENISKSSFLVAFVYNTQYIK